MVFPRPNDHGIRPEQKLMSECVKMMKDLSRKEVYKGIFWLSGMLHREKKNPLSSFLINARLSNNKSAAIILK